MFALILFYYFLNKWLGPWKYILNKGKEKQTQKWRDIDQTSNRKRAGTK